MHRALLELTVDGIETSREFHLRVMEDDEFRDGAIDIQWLERRLPSLLSVPPTPAELHAAAIAAALIADAERLGRISGATGPAPAGASASSNGEPPASGWARLARLES